MINLHVVNNLPNVPWERYEGEQFRYKFLLPAIENSAPTEKILIDFDRGYGYGTGFLKGVFDTPPEDYTRQEFFDKLEFKSDEEPLLIAEVMTIILDIPLSDIDIWTKKLKRVK